MAVFEKRTSKQGATSYRAKVRVKGRPTLTKTFPRLCDARRWAQKKESEIRDGRCFPKTATGQHTLSELIDRYLAEVYPKKSTAMQEVEKWHLPWWRKELGPYFIADITTAMIIECRTKLESGEVAGGGKRTSTTCNRYIATLRYIFTIAERDWEWIDYNPARKIVKLKEPSGRIRYLDEDERIRLLNECQKSKCSYLHLIVLLAVTTGMRYDEIRTLTWRQVHISQRCIILEKTKNGKRRRVPLSELALCELRKFSRVRRLDTDFLFPSPNDSKKPACVREAWRQCIKRASLKGFRFHDLRHTAASYFAMSGATTRDLCDIFGWETMQMAMRYAHLSDTHTAELADKMTEKFVAST